MTSIFGITERGLKTTRRDINVLPATVLYDPDLALELPLDISLFSGVNLIAHAAEALYADDRSPVSDLMAGEGIRALVQGMSKLRQAPRDPGGRGECLYGAWLCTMALDQVTMGLHHKLYPTLGGMLDLPHAETHTIMLPHTLAYNYQAAPQAMQRIESAIGTRQATTRLYDFIATQGLPMGL